MSGLSAGTRLGPYEITAPLGEGGMGEVYRARDTKLDRDVAIKVLPESFAADADRVARFTREAKTLASLNHPNIAGIYGIEANAIVMELVEGRDLSAMIGGLETQAALQIARQIIDALEAAHEQGIVHRDLKPQNIKVRADGTVKVLDFGLAKAMDSGTSGPLDPDTSPTMTARATQLGMIIGTAAYMSPEQARGKPVDRRADIWAFGVVFYEMLTGCRAFDGEDISVTLANVIKEDPKWEALPADVPASIRRLLRRCLEKDPKRRLSAIADARLELDEPDVPAPLVTTAPPLRSSKWIAIAAVATIAALALAAVTFVTLSNRPATAGVAGLVNVPVFLPDGMPAGGVAVSPDGRHVAFMTPGRGRPGIWIRSLDSSEARPVAGAEGGFFAFWSPDSRSIAFLSTDGKLRRVDISGGAPLVLADSSHGAGAGSWGSNGVILFGDTNSFTRVAASGGASSAVELEDDGGKDVQRGFPQFLRDGRRFFYGVRASGYRETLRVGSLDSNKTTLIPEIDTLPVWYSGDGYLLFMRGSMLMAQRFDEERLALVGDPKPVTPEAAPGVLTGRPSFSTSTNGVLAYVTTRLGNNGQLTWFDRSGKGLGSLKAPPDVEYLNPALNPDGTRLAVNRVDQAGNWDVWIVDVQTQSASRLTSDPAQDSDPVWSPDGNEIAFTSNRGGTRGIYRKALRSADAEQLVVQVSGDHRLSDWTRDGLLIYELNGDIMSVPLAGATHTPTAITQTPFFENSAKVSPDGKWIAFMSNETDTAEIYVQPFPGPGEKKLVSNGRGLHPRWRADGRELIFWGDNERVMSVDLRYDGTGVHASAPKFLLPLEIKVLVLVDVRPHYTATADGQRFLIRQPLGPAGPPIKVILNWAEGLRK